MNVLKKKIFFNPRKVIIALNNLNRNYIIFWIKNKKNIHYLKVNAKINLYLRKNKIYLLTLSESRKVRSLIKLYIKALYNLIQGSLKPFKKTLYLKGVGYKVQKVNKFLYFKLGYSHLLVFKLPVSVQCDVIKNTTLILTSSNLQELNLTAFKIRCLQKPDVYKGKGISYKDEILKLKEGKQSYR